MTQRFASAPAKIIRAGRQPRKGSRRKSARRDSTFWRIRVNLMEDFAQLPPAIRRHLLGEQTSRLGYATGRAASLVGHELSASCCWQHILVQADAPEPANLDCDQSGKVFWRHWITPIHERQQTLRSSLFTIVGLSLRKPLLPLRIALWLCFGLIERRIRWMRRLDRSSQAVPAHIRENSSLLTGSPRTGHS